MPEDDDGPDIVLVNYRAIPFLCMYCRVMNAIVMCCMLQTNI